MYAMIMSGQKSRLGRSRNAWFLECSSSMLSYFCLSLKIFTTTTNNYNKSTTAATNSTTTTPTTATAANTY